VAQRKNRPIVDCTTTRGREKKARLNLEVSPSTKILLDALKTRTEAVSIIEVIRRSLRAYAWLLDAQDRGALVIVREPDGTEREIVLI
jgi:hypothetical protein